MRCDPPGRIMRHGVWAREAALCFLYGGFSEMLRKRLGIEIRRNLARALFRCEGDVTVEA